MGDEASNLIQVENILKYYVFFTNESELTTHYISQNTSDKIASLSKQLRSDATDVLNKNIKNLCKKYEILLKGQDMKLS